MPYAIDNYSYGIKFPNVPHHIPTAIRKLTHSPAFVPPTHSIAERNLINSLRVNSPTEIIQKYENYLKQLDNGGKKDVRIERILMTALKENLTDILKKDDLTLYRQKFENIKNPFRNRIKFHQNAINAIKRQGKLLPQDTKNIREKNIEIIKLTAMQTALHNLDKK